MRVRANLGGGGSKYYTTTITPNTSSYTNIPCGFAPKYMVAYRLTTTANEVTHYWDIEAGTFVGTTNGSISNFEQDAKSYWVPDYFKVGADGKSIDAKAPAAGYVSVTRIIIVG